MKKIITLALTLLLALTACGSVNAQQEPLKVVTSFYPLYIFAQNILKDVPGVALSNLIHPTTGCLHDYQLLAGDMMALSQADALIINGGGMEAFLEPVREQFKALSVIDTSLGIELIPAYDLGHEEGETQEEHAQHDHGEFNAHIWLDPRNAIKMSAAMAEALSLLLPQSAARISSNLADYTARLSALDDEIRTQLSSLIIRDIVTFHEAFPYFAKAYGLHVVAVLALEPDQALTPQMLAVLVEKVRAANLPPLFTEPQYEDRAARAVALETGAQIYELDPIVTGDGAPDAYELGMRANARALVKALGNK